MNSLGCFFSLFAWSLVNFLWVPRILDLRKITVASAKSWIHSKRWYAIPVPYVWTWLCLIKEWKWPARFFLCFELKDWNKRCQLKCLRFTNLRRWTEKSHYFPRNILLISFLFKFQFTYFMNTRYTKKKKEVEIILACM